jgi:type IV secretion system protein VirB8
MNAKQEIIQEELIYGALRRARQWKIFGVCGITFGVVGCLSAAAVSILDKDPAPIIVPFDANTGMAVPNAIVKGKSLTQNAAVMEAQVHRYITNRETYNQVDNDIRIPLVLKSSEGRAKAQLADLWNSAKDENLQSRYGTDAVIEIDIISISIISNDRASVRLRKRLRDSKGDKVGFFTANLLFRFATDEERKLSEIWENPFGFVVKEYSITSDKLEK